MVVHILFLRNSFGRHAAEVAPTLSTCRAWSGLESLWRYRNPLGSDGRMDIAAEVKARNGFQEFNPMQRQALETPIYEKNLVISAPTASGKTIIAELCALNSIINNRRKVIYTCPLRALANEHYSDFRKKYSAALKVKFTISTGDFDSSSRYLANFDLIFTTYEKLDSLLRHNAAWLSQVGLLVVDEIHTLASGRGPTIEMAVAKLRSMNPKMQILALSATIPNAEEIARWLDAELVSSDYRPVTLKEGVYFADEVRFPKSKPEHKPEQIAPEKDAISSLALDTIARGKQALVFAATRQQAVGIAKRLSHAVEKILLEKEKDYLVKKSSEAENALESPTEQCKLLSELLRAGVSFHHAGLLQKQRTIVEDLFRARHIRVISATPTLAAGINLPAHTVIIPTTYRYGSLGSERIPVSEYKQMCGRAGRPKFDSEGRSVLVARSDLEAEELMEYYVEGQIEDVKSNLAFEPVLRTHLLGAVASNFVFDLDSMEKFFSRTFYACQYRNLQELFAKMVGLMEELREWGFVDFDGKTVSPTPLGGRVSELYLDPLSANTIINLLGSAKTSPLSYLFAIVSCCEFMPWLGVPRKAESGLWELLQESRELLPINLDIEMYADNALLSKFRSALLFRDWLEEVSEQNLMKEYGVQPGILHTKLQILDWLSYAAVELSRLTGMEQHFIPLNRLRRRLKYGIREELLPLVEVRGIGRVRARRLWRANVRTIAELKKIDAKDLARILGPGVALQIKQQLCR